jgi:uncharacterized protein
MIHPHTQLGFVNETVGYGLFATQLIPKGTIVWALDSLDIRLDPSTVKSLDPLRKKEILKFAYRDREGTYILCWDLGRYINHSFNANCIPTAYNFEIAARDIYPGEQLTDHYACLNLDEPLDCFPEEGCVKTQVMPEDLLNYYQEWDRQVAEAMLSFNKVEQPLKSFIAPEFADKVNAVAEGREALDSVLAAYYDRNKQRSLDLSVRS